MKQATDEERRMLWETLLLHSKCGQLDHGNITWIADQLQYGRKVVLRIRHQGIGSMGPRKAAVVKFRASARGTKQVDRRALRPQNPADAPARDEHKLLSYPAAYQRMIPASGPERTKLLLTAKHKEDRMRFCIEHVNQAADGSYWFDPLLDVVHIDEKWFYIKIIGQKVYILTGKDDVPTEEVPLQYAQSKSYLIKVIFLSAVACPREL
ncbi:hypothetical protein GN244_ATG03093 [Phytophthora infestans]|uniref:Uncharacterized protein n=1 Tax=Phytophthora infestans TaxID=4787 RepID=A0A833T1S5_PHYIN|nr:hypothetical protein GN244_ATG03093 [Phytophthora infestans]